MANTLNRNAIRLDLTIEQGANFPLSFNYLQADKTTPVDLTGLRFRLQIRLGTYDSPDATVAGVVKTFDSQDGTISVDLPTALVAPVLTPTDSRLLPLDTDLCYELRQYGPAATDEKVLFYGNVVIAPEVAQPA